MSEIRIMNPQTYWSIRALRILSSFVIRHSSFLLGLVFTVSTSAQSLNLPPRPANARSGSDVARMLIPLGVPNVGDARKFSQREAAICGQILEGNVPDWMRQMVQVTTNATINGANQTVSYYVTPDYLAIGSNQDYFLAPMTPLLGQFLADRLNCTMPTAKMVNDIWTKAPCKLAPSPIPWSPAMTTVPVFIDHNNTVRAQRFAVTNSRPLGTLTGGDKKDVVVSGRIYSNFANANITNTVVIYGWHELDNDPIQPVYNGHEETYADYSHGIRLAQMNVTLNGQPNTVTNILKNAGLAAVLSNDPYYTSNTIPVPRYRTFVPTTPIVTLHPASQTVRSNSAVIFSAFAIGDAPISYQWKLNGTNLPGATNLTLALSNVQPSMAGLYSVTASNTIGATNSIAAVLGVENPARPLLFSDDFETNSATAWKIFWGATNGIADYTVEWAHDYARESYTHHGAGYFIPPAPNSHGTSRGVKLTVNNNDATGSIAALNLYPKNKVFSNDYALKFDMWINYPGGIAGAGSSGSTEHAIFGINHLGTNANWAAPSAVASDGVWFGVSGEGGDSRDYRAYVGNLAGTQTELLGPASGLSQSNNTAGLYPTLFPGSRFETVGAPGKQWVEVEIRQVGNTLTWLMNDTVVAQRANPSAFTNGTVMIGHMDLFNSIANPTNHSFVLYDNVRVEDLTQTLQAPAISAPPQDQQCFIGTNVTFSVAANGSTPLHYRWLLDGAPISNATNQTLIITNVQPIHAGNYTVVVSNMVATASATATLTVSPAPARFQSFTRNATGEVSFTVTGSTGNSYYLETSTNLVSWEVLSMLTLSNGSAFFNDPTASNFLSRFYRATANP